MMLLKENIIKWKEKNINFDYKNMFGLLNDNYSMIYNAKRQ